MKKWMAFLLSCVLAGSMAACRAAPETAPSSQESASKVSTPSQSETEGEETSSSQEETNTQEESSRVLVVYFSATNTTEQVAERMAQEMGADLYEIVPEDPYTEEDLNYNDSGSRASMEQNDPEARPAIAGDVYPIDSYEVVFLGYPIWWGEAPKIMATFLERYDWTGKNPGAVLHIRQQRHYGQCGNLAAFSRGSRLAGRTAVRRRHISGGNYGMG